MTHVWKIGVLAAAIVLLAVRAANAASSCGLPPNPGCPFPCWTCFTEDVSCSYETSCNGFGDVPCSGNDATVDSFYCFPFGSAHHCERSSTISTSQCSSCLPGHYGAGCYLCPLGANGAICGGNGTCSDGIFGSGACSCNYGHTGFACQYSRTDTCNGHGEPDYNGNCSCDEGYAGTTCSYCAGDRYNYPYCTYCQANNTCSGNGYCNGLGNCECNFGFTGAHCNQCDFNYWGYPACRYCLAQQTCSGNGTCDNTGRCQCQPGTIGPDCERCASDSQCGGFACENGRCRTFCSSSDACAPGNYCNAGHCDAKLANGASCRNEPGDACGSGHCVDGVCCNSTCGEQCATCSAPGSVGTCTATVGAPTGGRPACAGDGSSCNGRCNGTITAHCVFPDATTTCRSPSCSAGLATAGAHCDGAGDCGALVQSSCGEYACGATTCESSCSGIDDCASSAFCTAGVCEADTEPPVVSFDLPPLTSQAIALTAQLTDNGRIASAQLIVNNAPAVASVDLAAGTLATLVLPLQEGPNTVLVRATDRAGNVGGHQVTVTRDSVAPSITFLSPVANQAISTPQVAVTVSVSDASASDVTVDTTQSSLGAGGGLASANVAFASSGVQTITATARDAAGNTRTVTIPILVDLDAPVLDVDVAPGATYGPLQDGLLPLTIHVDDVAATTVALGSQTFSLARGGGVVQAAVPLVEGTNTIAVTVTSETGRTSTLSRTVFYDTTPPVATMTIPSDGSFIAGGVELSVDATDAVSGVASVQFQIDGTPAMTAQGAPGQPWVLAFDTTQLVDGPHTVAATVLDRAGNIAALHADVTVDNTAPTVALVSPATGVYVHSTIAVQTTAADAIGVAQIAITANGTPIGSCPVATSCLLSYDTTANPDGNLLLSAIAIDRAGNRSGPASVDVISVNHIPASFIVSPTQGATIAGTMVVAVSVSDPYFASVECSVGGASLGPSTDPSFRATLDTLDMLDGPIAVSCSLADLAGNTSSQTTTATIKNWTLKPSPQMLNLRSSGNAFTIAIRGPNLARLLPVSQHALALVVPGGSPVMAGPSSNSDGTPDLTLSFDRVQVEASIRAGIAAHAIDPTAEVPVHIYAGGHDLGSTSIQVKE